MNLRASVNGDRVDLPDLAHVSANLGYQRVDMSRAVAPRSEAGSSMLSHPKRPTPSGLNSGDDEVDEIRAFSVQDQRTWGALDDGLWATACRELL